MRKFTGTSAALGLAAMFAAYQAQGAPATPAPSIAAGNTLVEHAQGAPFQLGISDGMVFSVMARNGYTDIEILTRRLTRTRASGCKGTIKYKVEVRLDGRLYKARPIGACRTEIGIDFARKILRQKGFRRIRLVPGGPGFVATACRDNRRIRVSVSRFGDIGSQTVLGRCGADLTRREIVALLRAYGFSRIRAKPARRGNFSVNACRNDDRVALLVGPGGGILRENRIGRCDPPIHPATIPALLARNGFDRIDVIDRTLPRYVARACRDTRRLEITMNRFGTIVDERAIGRCAPPMSAASLRARLGDAGYDAVRIVADDASGFIAEVCEEGARFRLDLTRYGETVSQTRIGDCASRRVRNVLKQLEREGIRDAAIYVEGCRGNRRVRVELDQYGSVLGRDAIGRCR